MFTENHLVWSRMATGLPPCWSAITVAAATCYVINATLLEHVTSNGLYIRVRTWQLQQKLIVFFFFADNKSHEQQKVTCWKQPIKEARRQRAKFGKRQWKWGHPDTSLWFWQSSGHHGRESMGNRPWTWRYQLLYFIFKKKLLIVNISMIINLNR